MGVQDERDTPTGCSEETPIEALELGVSIFNTLRRSGINYVGQILALAPGDLQRIRNMTPSAIAELHARLIEHGCMDRDRPLGPFGHGLPGNPAGGPPGSGA